MASAISIFDLRQRLSAGDGLTLIDVRTPAEYAEVHVREALSRPLDRLDPETLAAWEGGRTRQIHLICRTQNRARLAASALEKAGFTDLVVVEGGTAAWHQAGFPVTRGTTRVISLERQVRIAAGSLVVLGVGLSLAVHPAFIALSGFVGAGLVFAGLTDFCGLGLLIARAPWNARA